MRSHIAATSWVTPLGNDVETVWQDLIAGRYPVSQTIYDERAKTGYLVYRVAGDATRHLSAYSRLRRASAISRFAAAAGLAALAKAQPPPDLQHTALVFAISNGGVIYTRRFFDGIISSGPQSASPLLFPETVFNAPASHLAAILGINGACYTVVGDGAVGILALKFADDLLAAGEVHNCLVVGSEEIDPLVCEAYRQWRLLRDPRHPRSTRGMIVSEGAGAVLLARSGGHTILQIDAGMNYFRRAELPGKLRRILNNLGWTSRSCCIGSANGTFIDRAEESVFGKEGLVYSPKTAMGDAMGAAGLWQTIVAAQVLQTRTLPGSAKRCDPGRVFVLACGVNQQIAGLALGSEEEK